MADTIDVVYRFQSDRAATNSVIRDAKRIDEANQQSAKTVQRIADSYDDVTKSAERTAQAQREAAESSIRAAREQSELLGDVASRSSQLSGALSGLGAMGGQRLMIAADILDAAEAASLLRAEFPAMISQMFAMRGQMLLLGGAAGAIGLVVLALNQYNKEKEREKEVVDDAREAAKNYADQLTDVYTFLADATREDIKARIEDAETEVQGLQRTRAALIGEAVDRQREVSQLFLEMFPDAASLPAEQYKQLLDVVLGISEIDNANLDAVARMFDLDAFEAQYGDLALQAGAAIQTYIEQTDGLQSQIEDTNKEIDLLTVAFDNTAESAQKAAEAQGALKVLNSTFDALSGAIKTAREQSTELAQNMNEGARIIAESENEIAKATGEYEQERRDAIERGEQAIANITQQYEDQRAKTLADFAKNQQKATDDFGQKQAQLAEGYTEKRLEIERDSLDKVAELNRDFAESQARESERFQRDQVRALEDHQDRLHNAAARRDAFAVIEEQRNFIKEQRRAKEDFSDEQRERKREHDQQLQETRQATQQRLNELRQANDKELSEARKAYQARVNDLRTTLNIELSGQRAAYVQRITEQNAANVTELNSLRQAHINRISEMQRAQSAEISQLFGFNSYEYQVRQDHYDRLRAQLANLALSQFGGASGISSTFASAVRNVIPFFADGGYTQSGLAMMHDREFVLNPSTTNILERGLGGPLTQQRMQSVVNNRSVGDININNSGGAGGMMTPAQIRGAVVQALAG